MIKRVFSKMLCTIFSSFCTAAIFVDQLTKESSSKSSLDNHHLGRAEMKIEVNLCSIISSLSYLWSCFSVQYFIWWYLLTIAFFVFCLGEFLLMCLSAWSRVEAAAARSIISKKAKGKMKKNIPLTGKVYLPTKRRKIKCSKTEAINDSEGIRSDFLSSPQ